MVLLRGRLTELLVAVGVAAAAIGCAGCAPPAPADSTVTNMPTSGTESVVTTSTSSGTLNLRTLLDSPRNLASTNLSSMPSVGATEGGLPPLLAPELPTITDVATSESQPTLVKADETVNLIGDPWKLTAAPADFDGKSLTDASIYERMVSAIPKTADWTSRANQVSLVVGAFHRNQDPDGHSIYAYLRLGGLTCVPNVGAPADSVAALPLAKPVPCNVGIFLPLRGEGNPLSVQGVA